MVDARLVRAREILIAEGQALERAAHALDQRFLEVVDVVLALRGKVVLTGVGKSGLIAHKIAATLSSTGTPSLFLHAVEAVMGDLGILSKDDLLIAISASGEVNEVVNVVVAAQRIGTPAVAMTRNPESSLARECRYLLPIVVDREACPLGLAPTTSTTVTLGIGDALAMTLMEAKRFSAEQFKLFHPGGNLGRRLAVRVRDLMGSGECLPVFASTCPLREALPLIAAKGYGVALVTDDDGRLVGVVTDGDVRRALAHAPSPGTRPLLDLPLADVMTRDPVTIEADIQASEALRIMETSGRGIMVLPIVDSRGRPAGIVHIHDILGRGKFIL